MTLDGGRNFYTLSLDTKNEGLLGSCARLLRAGENSLPSEVLGCVKASGGTSIEDPGVIKDSTCIQPLLGVLDQEPLDEVLGLWGDSMPVGVGEGEGALLDAGEETLLAVSAGLPPSQPQWEPQLPEKEA